MVAPNRQSLVNKHEIHVSLLPGQEAVSVTVRSPLGKLSHPQKVNIKPLLAGGLTEVEALEWAIRLVGIALEMTD